MGDIRVRIGYDYDPSGMQAFRQDAERSIQETQGLATSTEAVSQEADSMGAALAGAGVMASLAIGVLVGVVSLLWAEVQKSNEALDDLNRTLDAIAKKGEVAETLGNLLGVSRELAEEWLNLARQDPSMAKTLQEAADAAQSHYGAMEALAGAWKNFATIAGPIGTFLGGVRDLMENLAKAEIGVVAGWLMLEKAVVEGRFGDALSEFQKAWDLATQAADVGTQKVAESIEELNAIAQRNRVLEFMEGMDRVAAEWDRQAEALERARKAEEDKKNRDMARVYREEQQALQSLTNALSDQAERASGAFAKMVDSQAEAQQSFEDTARRNDWALGESLATAAQGLANRRADISQNLRDKQADQDHDYFNRLADLEREDLQRVQQLGDELLRLNRQEQESLYQLDFNTSRQLAAAKTDREREEIGLRALFERASIERRTDDARTEAVRRMDDERRLSDERRRLLNEEFAYRRAVDLREAGEQLATAQRTYDQQTAVAKQRHKDQTDDAILNLQRENERIAQRYANEMQAIETATAHAQRSYQQRMAWIAQEEGAVNRLASAYNNLGVPAASPFYQAPIPAPGLEPQAYQSGGTISNVPFGQPVLAVVHGGERVVPATQTEHAATQTVFISPEPLVAPVVQDLVRQFAASQAFREGVRVVLVDEAWR